jgi:hypothetical protein
VVSRKRFFENKELAKISKDSIIACLKLFAGIILEVEEETAIRQDPGIQRRELNWNLPNIKKK